MSGFKYFVPINKASQGDDGDWYIEGVASGTREDRDEQKMSVPILNQFADAIRTMTLPLTNSHPRPGDILGDIGDVIDAQVMDDEDNSLFVRAKLDKRNPAVPFLLQKIGDGKRFAFSIEGNNPEADTVWSTELNKPVVEFRSATPKAISVTGEPSYMPSFFNVLKKSYANNLKDQAIAIEKTISTNSESGETPGSSETLRVKQYLIEKRKFSSQERKKDAGTGAALPDGAFPIENEEDLKNAIHAYGRAKDKTAAMAHIKSRAKSLSLENLIPDEWKSDTKKENTKKSVAQSDDALVKINLDINKQNMSKTVKDVIQKGLEAETEVLTQSKTEQPTETSKEEEVKTEEETKTEEVVDQKPEDKTNGETEVSTTKEEVKSEDETKSTEDQSAQEDKIEKSAKQGKDMENAKGAEDNIENADAKTTDTDDSKEVKKSSDSTSMEDLCKAVSNLTAEVASMKKDMKKSVEEDTTTELSKVDKTEAKDGIVIKALINLTTVVKSLVDEVEVIKSLPLAKKSLVTKSFEDRAKEDKSVSFTDIAKLALGE